MAVAIADLYHSQVLGVRQCQPSQTNNLTRDIGWVRWDSRRQLSSKNQKQKIRNTMSCSKIGVQLHGGFHQWENPTMDLCYLEMDEWMMTGGTPI